MIFSGLPSRCPGPPGTGISSIGPSLVKGASRRPHDAADLDDLRVRSAAGRSHAVHPSITCGPDAPSPSMHRPSDSASTRLRSGQEGRRAGVDRQDPRPDLHPLGAGRQIAHEAHAVGRTPRRPSDVENRPFEIGNLTGRLLETAGVVDRHRDLAQPGPQKFSAPLLRSMRTRTGTPLINTDSPSAAACATPSPLAIVEVNSVLAEFSTADEFRPLTGRASLLRSIGAAHRHRCRTGPSSESRSDPRGG